MPSTSPNPKRAQPMSDAKTATWEASRDLEAELLGSEPQFKRGEGRGFYLPHPVSVKGGDTPWP